MNCLFWRRIAFQLSSNYNQRILTKTIRHLNTYKNNIFRSEDLLKCLSQNKYQSNVRTISSSQEINLFSNKLNDVFVGQKRFKKGKKGSKREVKEESDEDSDAEEEKLDEFDPDLIDGKAIGFQDVDSNLVSLRLDNVAKSGLNMARNKVDEAFYKNMIRVNGERVSKKSIELVEEDEVDLIKGLNEENQDLIDVSRVVIKKIEDKLSSKDRIRAKLRKFKNLTIENYPKDPYDGFAINIVREDKKDKKDKKDKNE